MTNPVVSSSISVVEGVAIIIVCLQYALESGKIRDSSYIANNSQTTLSGEQNNVRVFHASSEREKEREISPH